MEYLLIKKFAKICKYFLVFIIITPIYSITIPEGIRGFAITYGTWIETVLSQSLLKDLLFPEDVEQYNKFQRLIFTSERLSEEGNAKEAMSYLRRADFYLQDFGKTLGRKYGLSNESYSQEEMVNWSDKQREIWTMYQYHKITLLIEYEYYYILNNPPSPEYRPYVEKIETTYNSLNQNTSAYNKIKSSAFPLYLMYLRSSWDSAYSKSNVFSINQMMIYLSGHSDEFLNGKEYWKTKFIKRSILLLSKYGYPEKAWYLTNHLRDDNSDILPVKTVINLMVYNAKYQEAENYILDIINTIKVNDMNNWGAYITYQKYYLNLLLIQKKNNTYNASIDKFISQLHIFLQRIDLSRDIYEYIDYHLNDAILNKNIVNYYNDKNMETFKELNINTYEFTTSYILNKKDLLASYSNDTLNLNFENFNSMYRTFQYHLKKQNLQQVNNILLKLENTFPENELIPVLKLQYALKNKEYKISHDNWYKIWIQGIYSRINNPIVITSVNSGLIFNFDIESEFFKFYLEQKTNFSAEEIYNILYALSTLAEWESKMLNPPAYNRPIDYKIRYAYLAKWGFSMSDEPLNNPLNFVSFDRLNNYKNCTFENTCWILYPTKDSIYSIIIKNSLPVSITELPKLSEIISLSNTFFLSLENHNKNKDQMDSLAALSEKFKPVIKQFQSIVIPDNIVYLNAFKFIQLLPLEALLIKSNNIHFADEYKIVRKLPYDQAYIISCEKSTCNDLNNDSNQLKEKNLKTELDSHFFLGIGNTTPGFLIANSNVDELLDIEGLFLNKKIFSESNNLSGNVIHSIEDMNNTIFHMAGQWTPENEPIFFIESKKNGIPLNNFRYIENFPYLILSKNRIMNFNIENYSIWDKILTSFRHKNTKFAIISLSVSPKEFRQAFFYDFYYRIEHKKSEWLNAFFSSTARTKKGFSESIWPYLMVIYEK